jgi:hypothetical protein
MWTGGRDRLGMSMRAGHTAVSRLALRTQRTGAARNVYAVVPWRGGALVFAPPIEWRSAGLKAQARTLDSVDEASKRMGMGRGQL